MRIQEGPKPIGSLMDGLTEPRVFTPGLFTIMYRRVLDPVRFLDSGRKYKWSPYEVAYAEADAIASMVAL